MTLKIDPYATIEVHPEPFGARLLLQQTGQNSWSGSVFLQASQVDGLVKLLMAFGTYSQEPDEERQQVRALLEKVTNAEPDKDASRGYSHTKPNVKLATCVVAIVKNVIAREKRLQDACQEYHKKILELEKDKRALDALVSSGGLDPELTTIQKISRLLADRREAQKALAGK